MKFIFSHADYVKEDTLRGLIYNQDRDITQAFNQIHQESIKRRGERSSQISMSNADPKGAGKRTYAEMVQQSSGMPSPRLVSHDQDLKIIV